MKLQHMLILLILLISIHPCLATESTTIEKRLDITTGLAHNGVSCAIKDSRGYLWIGTYDGLNRFDGDEITIYKNSVGVELFQSNRIRTIAEDRDGLLWIGTEQGVTLMNYDKHLFTQLPYPSESESPIVRHICISGNGEQVICIGESESILIYNLLGEIVRCDRLPHNTTITSAIHYKEEKYLLTCKEGLMVYDSSNGHIQELYTAFNKTINAVTKYDDETLLVSYDMGLQHISIDDTYTITKLSGVLYDSMRISSLAIDSTQTLWMGCESSALFTVDNISTHLGTMPTTVVEEKRVSGVLFDYDRVYILTFDNGIMWLSTRKPKFTVFDNGKISQPHILAFDHNHLLINTAYNLTPYNLATGHEESLPFDIPPSLKAQHKLLLKDNNQTIWILSTNSNYQIELHKVVGSRTTKVKSDKLSSIGEESYPIGAACDGNGNFWVAYINDLFRISFNELGEITRVESVYESQFVKSIGKISRARVLYYDKTTDALWVGTNKQGLFKIHLNASKEEAVAELKIENYTHNKADRSSLSANFVSAILRSTCGTLWVGTEQGGLCRGIEHTDGLTFETISEEDGLSNNVIKSIQEDRRGNLWIGTNIGLNKYIIDKNRFVIYRSDDGVPIDDFWYHALSLENGSLVFAGVNEIISFDPDDFYTYNDITTIYLDRFSINNTEIRPNEAYDGSVIFDQMLKDGSTLNLKYNQNNITFGVDLINNLNRPNHTIYYKLLPLNNDWVKMSRKSRTISFNGLTPDRYQLYISASDPMGVIGGDTTCIHINIAPPFWKSIYAYTLYLLILFAMVGVIVYALLSFQLLNHRLHIRTIEKNVNEDKLRYFSNISHELKTPLSLILAPVAMLRERFSVDKEVTNKLDIIKRQSQKLLELIELTHGIEANDLKNLTPKLSLFSFEKMIREITIDFEFVTSYDNKLFCIEGVEHPIAVEADRAMIEKVINNLLSNALKHTTSGDEIVLSYTVEKNCIVLCVKDTGYGIGAEDLPHIFERFYQARRSGANNMGGTGIGLTFSKMLVELHGGTIGVESQLNIGSTFTVTLPIVVDKVIEEKPPHTTLIDEIIDDTNDATLVVKGEYASSVIFVVEDNPELRSLLYEIVGNYFQVKVFASGSELLEALDNEWPDLMISDVMMPEIDGYELCKRVKEDVKTSHIPVILLTACTTVDDRIKGLNAGADAYIPKPFYPKHLITRIETLLHNRQQLRERFQVGIPLVYGKDGNNSAKDNEFMHQLYELFNKNLSNEDINLDMIARELGQNRSMFFKKVKAITNSSPYELLKEYRLTKAAELLQANEYSVSEICVLTGFKDRSHFSRRFKEKFNVSPSQYSKAKRDE